MLLVIPMLETPQTCNHQMRQKKQISHQPTRTNLPKINKNKLLQCGDVGSLHHCHGTLPPPRFVQGSDASGWWGTQNRESNKAPTGGSKRTPPTSSKKMVLKPEIYGLGVPIHSFWEKVCATHVLSGEVSSHRVGLVLLQITCSMRCAMGHACICWWHTWWEKGHRWQSIVTHLAILMTCKHWIWICMYMYVYIYI